jgi:A/G-specific adenine glycosylase
MKPRDIIIFKTAVKDYYRKNGRHDLPWRHTVDPYRIAVSEIMLQQTQVSRVIEKYKEFLKAFPTVKKLAAVPLSEVLRLWSGLGYNRRAKFLHQMAQVVTTQYKGKFPDTIQGLQKLPGIGPYTAGAIGAFAYNIPHSFIETNIRTVYIHHFFKGIQDVSDKELMPLIEKTLDTKNAREWYWALMDYGSYLKGQGNRVHRASKHYTKQSKFEGSRRQIRGAIMREVLKGPVTVASITKITERKKEDVQSVMEDLVSEGFITKERTTYKIS